jgi:hypothetical protein
MDYQKKYELLKKNVWDVMQQLRDMPHDEESGSWANINTISSLVFIVSGCNNAAGKKR